MTRPAEKSFFCKVQLFIINYLVRQSDFDWYYCVTFIVLDDLGSLKGERVSQYLISQMRFTLYKALQYPLAGTSQTHIMWTIL